MVNYPSDLKVLLKLLSSDDISYLTGERLGGITHSATKIKSLVTEFMKAEDELDFQEILENKYPKELKYLEKETEGSDLDSVIDKVWENLKKYSEAIKNYSIASRKPDDLSGSVEVIINSEGVDDEVFEGFMDFLMRKEEDVDEVSSKSFINSLKKQLGFDDRGRNIKFLEKTRLYFSDEAEPALQKYINKKTYSFNYGLLRIVIGNGKNAAPNTSYLTNERGFVEKNEGSNTILQKIFKIDEQKKEMAELKLDNIVTLDGKPIRKVTIEYNYPLLYELLIENDKVIQNISRYNIKRKTTTKLEVGSGIKDKLPLYFKIIREGGEKVTIESKKTQLDPRYTTERQEGDKPTEGVLQTNNNAKNIRYDLIGSRGASKKQTRIDQEAIELLLFSVFNQKNAGFYKFFYKKTGKKYKTVPFFENIVRLGGNIKPVDKAISYLTVNVGIDSNQYLEAWVRRNITGDSNSARKKRRDKVKSIQSGEIDSKYEQEKSKLFGGVRESVDTISLTVFDAVNDFLTELSEEDKEDFDEFINEGLDIDEYEVLGTTVKGVLILDGEVREKWNTSLQDDDFIEVVNELLLESDKPTIDFGSKAIRLNRESEKIIEDSNVGDKFKTVFEQGIASEVYKLMSEGKNIDSLLTIELGELVNSSKKSPMTLKKAIILSHFLARRYGQQGNISQLVENINTHMGAKLSIGDDRFAQAIVDLASAINEGCSKFAKEFINNFEERMNDIANKPSKYYNLYYSTFMEKLLSYKILRGVSD